jgi:uncharacterized integral membrane protein
VKNTGFAGYVGGVMLCILAVLLAVFGVVVTSGLLNFYVKGYNIPLGIVILVVALFLFAYGWYLYKSNRPRGTLNVHNV